MIPWRPLLAFLSISAGTTAAAGYVVVGAALFIWMRRRGYTWESFSRDALRKSEGTDRRAVVS